jgi:hypothetical protein
MKPPRQFGPLPQVRYRPELTHCPHCGARLALSHPVWAKPIQSLERIEHVTSLGFRCSNPSCLFPRVVYRSAQAEARQVKGSGYGLEVVARIGHLRFSRHRTREEIWRQVTTETPVQLSERHVQNLLEVYLALLRASQQDLPERLASTVEEHGGLVVSLDGLQPEQGNEQLWVVREVLSGGVLGAANLQQATGPMLSSLLEPIRASGLPVLGVISDAQESIRLAVAAVFPGVPHQLCQYHALREAAEPLWEADRHLLVEAKKELRGLREVEERTRQPDNPEPTDPASAVVLDTVLALRQTVRERGVLPFDFAGLRALDALSDLGTTLDRCLEKKGDPRLARLRTLIGRAQARCAAPAAELRQAHAWLLEIARRLEPPSPTGPEPPPSGAQVRARVEAGLDEVTAACQTGTLAAWLRPKAEHLVTVLRRLGDGLYHCYDVPGLPRTDNDLEQFYRRLKTQARRITGHKRSDAFVVRVGGFAAYATATSGLSEAELQRQLMGVAAAAWQPQRALLRATQERQTKMRRYHLHRAAYLSDLEARWAQWADPR